MVSSIIRSFLFSVLFLCTGFVALTSSTNEPVTTERKVMKLSAKETLTALEMNCGDQLEFTLHSGRVVTLRLIDTDAKAIYSNLTAPKKKRSGGYFICGLYCTLEVNGHPLKLRRFLPVQESFYEPIVVDGVRIWFDAVKDVANHLNEEHGKCFPTKDARFALQDATRSIAPVSLSPWYPNAANYIDIADVYGGDDVWMGPYQGADAHGGLDVTMPVGSPIWTPFAVDDHYLFHDVLKHEKNNRWRGIRRWDNGDLWTIQAHHLVELTVPERTPLPQGKHYAYSAGVYYGFEPHTHFVFKIGEEANEILLDPWILFWQIFEDNKTKAGEIKADMAPLQPAKTGEMVAFSSTSRKGITGGDLQHYWTFGDGGFSIEQNPRHVYAKPGIYPVTLVVSDHVNRATTTHMVTVNGPAVDQPSIALSCMDESSFDLRETSAQDVYGEAVKQMPHTVRILSRKSFYPKTGERKLNILNSGGGTLSPVECSVHYEMQSPVVNEDTNSLPSWLNVAVLGEGDEQQIAVSTDYSMIRGRGDIGLHRALVEVKSEGALNSPAQFLVELIHPPRTMPQNLSNAVTIHIESPECHVTPYFWLMAKFSYFFTNPKDFKNPVWPHAFNKYWRINSAPDGAGQYARFRPELVEGQWQVKFNDKTPFPIFAGEKEPRFKVRVKHAKGTETLWVEPVKNRVIGTFFFNWGNEGYVDILGDEIEGHIALDALDFVMIKD